MTYLQAKKLQAAWAKLDDLPCDHATLVLQENDRGFLTGQYVCTRCGDERMSIASQERLAS